MHFKYKYNKICIYSGNIPEYTTTQNSTPGITYNDVLKDY